MVFLLEAEIIKKEIIELLNSCVYKRIEDFDIAVEDQLKNLEIEQTKTLDDFEENWQQKLLEFEDEVGETEASFLELQKKDREEYLLMIKDKVSIPVKMSKKYIGLKAKMDQLSKQHRFDEAAVVKLSLQEEKDIIENKEAEDMKSRIFNKMNKFDSKQEIELKNLQDKITTNRNEYLSNKQKEYDLLIKKINAQRLAFENKVSECE